jgi:hypothetical protein
MDARLDALERSIAAKLELLAGAADVQRVVCGVASLAAQVKAKQAEIEALRRQLEEEKMRAGIVITQATLDGMKRELEELRAANAALELATRGNDERIAGMQAVHRGSAATAQTRARTLVKKMMDGVFEDTAGAFEPKKLYAGADVANQLRTMLKKHSVACFADIKENGLF